MKHTATTFILVIITVTSYSQQLFFNIAAGTINYGGDLQDRSFTFRQAHSAFSAGIALKFTHNLLATASFTTGKLGASDVKTNTIRQSRNLSFYSNLTEGSLRLEGQLRDVPGTYKFTPYAFAGAAIFHYNPYAFDTTGEKVYLQPLSTEGEGLPQYPDIKSYRLTQFAIPFGGGFTYAVSNNLLLSAEVGFRKLFTDYLDDVSSSRYADTAILRAEKGGLSAKMSYRSDETSNPVPFRTDLQRGNPGRKDIYYTCLIKLSFSLGNMGSSTNWYSRKAKKQCGCPGKVL